MSFDPGVLTVKEAMKRLSGLSDEELSAVYDVELDGKGRTSLLDEITEKRDALRASSEEVAEEAPAEAVVKKSKPAPARRTFTMPTVDGLGLASYVVIDEEG